MEDPEHMGCAKGSNNMHQKIAVNQQIMGDLLGERQLLNRSDIILDIGSYALLCQGCAVAMYINTRNLRTTILY